MADTNSPLASSAFGGQRPPSPSITRSGKGTDSGIKVRGNDAQELVGTDFRAVDKRKFKYDVLAGRAHSRAIGMSKDDRMSAEEAGNVLESIHQMCGVKGMNEDVLEAFDRSLWVCHTVNSGSTLVPGRSRFSVPGITRQFDYSIIKNKLGIDFRRFFRAYADEIREANEAALKAYDPRDFEAMEVWGWIQQVAFERGMQRFPHLAHDSADACLHLSSSERLALHSSRKAYLSARENVADVGLAQRD